MTQYCLRIATPDQSADYCFLTNCNGDQLQIIIGNNNQPLFISWSIILDNKNDNYTAISEPTIIVGTKLFYLYGCIWTYKRIKQVVWCCMRRIHKSCAPNTTQSYDQFSRERIPMTSGSIIIQTNPHAVGLSWDSALKTGDQFLDWFYF